MLRKTLIAGLAAAALAPAFGLAQTPPAPAGGPPAGTPPAAAPTPEHAVTGNVGLFSQYIFRGLTQTDHRPALQGGFDYAHRSGLYAGTWASNISWLRENASTAAPATAGTYRGGGNLEWDFYAGYKMGLPMDLTLDLGTLYYYYPGSINNDPTTAGGSRLNIKADTWEAYVALSWKWLSAKYSYSLMNRTFAVRDSSGSWYLDLSANVPLGEFYKPLDGFTFIAHWGHQDYSGTDPRNYVVGGSTLSNDTMFTYSDWKVGLQYALPKDFTVGAYYTDTSGADARGYGSPGQCAPGGCGVYPRNIAKGTGTVFLQKTF